MNSSKQDIAFHPGEIDYSFGRFCLRSDGTLFRDEDEVHLPPKELQLLRVLLSHAGEVVSSEKLLLTAWGGVHVSGDSLPRCISSLRAHLKSQDCIQTIYKRGYRFTMTVEPAGFSAQRERTDHQKELDRRVNSARNTPRLAILPFATSEGVPEFLGKGIADQIALRLVRMRNPVAEVMARDSVYHLAAQGATAREVGSNLGADMVVAGVLSPLAMNFRLRIEMIRVTDAAPLWVEDFLVPRDLLAYADSRAAKRITARIRNTFATAIAPAVPATASGSPALSASFEIHRREAYLAYLEASGKWNSFGRDDIKSAMRGFQTALDLESNILDPRIHLVHGYLAQSSYGYLQPDVAAQLARNQADYAFSHSTGASSLYPALGWIYFHHDRNFAAAAHAFAHSQLPGINPWSVIYRTRYSLGQGRFNEAIGLLRTALETDPFSPIFHGRLAWALFLAGEERAAIEQASRTQRLFPDHPGALFFSAIIFAASSKPGASDNPLARQATAIANRLIQTTPSLDPAYATLAYVQARQGCIVEARTLLDRQQRLSRERYVMRSFHAPALVELGESDAAIEALVRADKDRCPWLFELLSDPRMRPLHGEREFQRLFSHSRQLESADASVA
jgi:DNA-binding winged helix-turn-helix (wHTH) protein/tetratricopeptide (TPR) repeat protein